MPKADDLPFRVERYDLLWEWVEELLATAANFPIAKAAYDAAVKREPSAAIMLRDRARVIAKNDDPSKEDAMISRGSSSRSLNGFHVHLGFRN